MTRKQQAKLSAEKTTDHDTIRKWVEERGGHPSTVRRSATESGPGILRIDFPGYSGEESLQQISWDEFFTAFDENNLAFLHQDHTASGELSRFCKLVRR